jgi:hypothetical protein
MIQFKGDFFMSVEDISKRIESDPNAVIKNNSDLKIIIKTPELIEQLMIKKDLEELKVVVDSVPVAIFYTPPPSVLQHNR